MILYTTNQRYSRRYTGSTWVEEVLCASGVAVDNSNFHVISGATAQLALQAIDNTLSGTAYSTASGCVFIEEAANVSGVTSSTLGNLDAIIMPSGSSNSAFRFSFGVPAQPVSPVYLRTMFATVQAAAGNVKLNLDYSIFDQNSGSNVLSGTVYNAATITASATLTSGNSIQMHLLNFQVPVAAFTVTGSAPYIFSGQITRDASVASNVVADVAVVKVYADNIPGAMAGNTAGYVGGNLEVTGNLTVDGVTVLPYNTAPASASGTGTSGSLILSDPFIYVATATNTWKRVPVNSF
jgi:hypothetical protein